MQYTVEELYRKRIRPMTVKVQGKIQKGYPIIL